MTVSSHRLIKATSQASPNIALIKYWGNRDHSLRIPANGSISITLGDLSTTTTVTPDVALDVDQLTINGKDADSAAIDRAAELLSAIRSLSGHTAHARIQSENSFPMGAGIASSASAFAALAQAGCHAYGVDLDSRSLSRLARRASGSAARSICPGFVELHTAAEETMAYAESIFAEDHWDLIDIIVVLDSEHKAVGSSEGHRFAETSPLQRARVADAPRRIEECKRALETKDFDRLAAIVELDSNLMHAIMMSSNPSLMYWQAETVALMQAVGEMREQGFEVCYTIDAGPNVHCICSQSSSNEVQTALNSFEWIQDILISKPGPGARIL